MVLEFVSTQPPREARAFLGEMAHILNAIFGALQQARAAPMPACSARCSSWPARRRSRSSSAADEPLDESWAEPPVFDGCSSKGQARPGQPQPIHIVRKDRPDKRERPHEPVLAYLHDFLFSVYPYICLAVFLMGSLARFDRDQYTWKSDSSQMLRTGTLRWGSNLFHVGILFLFFGHLVGPADAALGLRAASSARRPSRCSRSSPAASPGCVCFVGLTLLLLSPHLRSAHPPDQPPHRHRDPGHPVGAAGARPDHAAVFVARTADGSAMLILADWAQRIVTFRPRRRRAGRRCAWPYMVHMVLGMTIFLLFPFSRLVHVWSGFATVAYLFRPLPGRAQPAAQRAGRPQPAAPTRRRRLKEHGDDDRNAKHHRLTWHASTAWRCTRRTTALPPDELRQRACTELLRQAAQRAGLLERGRRAVSGRRDQRSRRRRHRIAARANGAACPSRRKKLAAGTTPRTKRTYRTGERVLARHILFAVTPGVDVVALRKRAETTLLEVRCHDGKAADRFANAARDSSNCPSGAQGGDLGWLSAADCAPEFARELFGRAEVGVLPRLVHSRFGLHVVEVLAREPGVSRSFEAVRGAVTMSLRQQAYVTALRQYLQLLAGAADGERRRPRRGRHAARAVAVMTQSSPMQHRLPSTSADDLSISCFDDLLRAARQRPEPQRLLFVFMSAELPEDSTPEQRVRFAAGVGGTLVPLMCVDKASHELTTFAALAEESRASAPEWAMVFVACLAGQVGRAVTHDDAEAPLQRMVDAIKAGSHGSFVPFDRDGQPVLFE